MYDCMKKMTQFPFYIMTSLFDYVGDRTTNLIGNLAYEFAPGGTVYSQITWFSYHMFLI